MFKAGDRVIIVDHGEPVDIAIIYRNNYQWAFIKTAGLESVKKPIYRQKPDELLFRVDTGQSPDYAFHYCIVQADEHPEYLVRLAKKALIEVIVGSDLLALTEDQLQRMIAIIEEK